MLSLRQLRENKNSVTAILFRKDGYTFEGILRWLMDRGFSCEGYEETEHYYVFKQNTADEFNSFEFHQVEDFNITVEIGSKKDGEITRRGVYPQS